MVVRASPFSSVLVNGLLAATAAAAQAPPFLTKWGSQGSAPGQFQYPQLIALDDEGYLYVTDAQTCRIQKFTSGGAFAGQWGSPGSGPGQFTLPTGIAVSASGLVYVTDQFASRVQVFTTSGSFVRQWGTEGGRAGQVLPAHRDCRGRPGPRVRRRRGPRRRRAPRAPPPSFQSDGTYVRGWGSRGSGPGQFRDPWGVAIGPDGNVYVVDGSNQRIEVFTPTGTFLTQWGLPGSGPGQFDGALGIAIDNAGQVYVTEWGDVSRPGSGNRIQVFSASGALLTQWGSYGSDPGEFDKPYGIAVDDHGRIFVSEDGNYRVQVFGTLPTAAARESWGALKARYR